MSRSRKDFSVEKYVALTGPNFATEIANQKPTISVIASQSRDILNKVKMMLENAFFKIVTTNDVIGVEISGVLKNIIALIVGMVEGADLGENLRGYVFAEALKEALDIGVNLFGAQLDTLLGPSCVGDAVATSFSTKSRNKLLGLLLAKRVVPTDTMDSFLVEGVRNFLVVKKYLKKHNFRAPLFSSIASIIENKSPGQTLNRLINSFPVG